jgi:4-hydroxybenzoate polyprenyltransferase
MVDPGSQTLAWILLTLGVSIPVALILFLMARYPAGGLIFLGMITAAAAIVYRELSSRADTGTDVTAALMRLAFLFVLGGVGTVLVSQWHQRPAARLAGRAPDDG